jgi:hypothetical protein
MRLAWAQIEPLREHLVALSALSSRVKPTGNSRALVDALLWHSRKMSVLLREMHQNLGGAAFPYQESEQRMLLSRYVVHGMPPPEDIGQIASAAQDALDAFDSLYFRIMADLAQRAEKIETDLGLPLMEEPAPIESSDTQSDR